MNLPYFIFQVLVGFLVPALSFMIIRVVLRKPPYKFTMIFMTPGVDEHITVYGNTLDFEHEINTKKYEIKAERLYRIKPDFAHRIINKFRGIKEAFIITYQDKQTDPIAPVNVKVSARILKEVSESRALDKAFTSEFRVAWDMKKILLLIGFLVIAVVVYVLISGDVTF